jgi:predicted ATPase
VVLRILAVQNYRSLRRLVLPLTQLNVVTGANGREPFDGPAWHWPKR